MNNLAIVVFSCDKNEELWPAFNKCLDKYWPNHPVTYLLTETLNYPNFITINHNYDFEKWTKRIRESLNDIKEDNLIFICDDCFLNEEVNLYKLKRSVEILEQDGYSNIQYELSYDPRDIDSIYPGFKEKTDNCAYKFSLLCGLWRKDKLIDVLKEDTDPWTVEYKQQYDKSHKFLQVSDKKIISWFNDQYGGNGAIRKGKWQKCVIDFFKREEIEMDFSKKGFEEE
jgi:hypothetical protein